MKPRCLIPILLSLTLAFSLAATPALAFGALQTGAGEDRERAEAAAQAKAQELINKIDAIPDDAGVEYRQQVESIRYEMDGGTTSKLCPPSLYMSDDYKRKIGAIEKRIREADEAEKAERSAQATAAAQATQTTTTTTSTSTNTASTSQPSSRQSNQGQDQSLSTAILIALIAWEVIWVIQVVLSYGTAYRKTKKSGDNGVALFGWLLIYSLASFIPGLGFYLWSRNK